MEIKLDPKLLDMVEYSVCRENGHWVATAYGLPLIGEVTGGADDPTSALRLCVGRLREQFNRFNGTPLAQP